MTERERLVREIEWARQNFYVGNGGWGDLEKVERALRKYDAAHDARKEKKENE